MTSKANSAMALYNHQSSGEVAVSIHRVALFTNRLVDSILTSTSSQTVVSCAVTIFNLRRLGLQ